MIGIMGSDRISARAGTAPLRYNSGYLAANIRC